MQCGGGYEGMHVGVCMCVAVGMGICMCEGVGMRVGMCGVWRWV